MIGDRNSSAYRRARKALLASGPVCVWCRTRPATEADHVPAVAEFPEPFMWRGELVPACRQCNLERGAKYGHHRRKTGNSREW